MRQEWRCSHCGKLLGVLEGIRLRIRFSRGYDYSVGLPATAVCWGCGAVNRLPCPEGVGDPQLVAAP